MLRDELLDSSLFDLHEFFGIDWSCLPLEGDTHGNGCICPIVLRVSDLVGMSNHGLPKVERDITLEINATLT
jgi:hypothetical protein